jgi:prolipoprotein diacylglyceryltransferase/protein-S-isoprenylcysteine O-methyltransferase Ste14
MKRALQPAGFGKVLYGLLFTVVLPVALAAWAFALDAEIDWPVPPWQVPGILAAAGGAMLMILGSRDLFVHGRGLPMNAYPPAEFVTRGSYAWFPHPMYLGAVLVSFGVSLWFRSASGLYIVSPVLALMTISLVWGYERLATRKRFGHDANESALFGFPPASVEPVRLLKRIAIFLRLLIPWLVAGYVLDYARCGGACSGPFMQLLDSKDWRAWTDLLWAVPMLFVLIQTLRAHTAAQLLRSLVAGTIGTFLTLYLDLVLPPLGIDLMGSRPLFAALNLIVFGLAWSYRAIWLAVRSLSEWVANSRRDWLLFGGRLRIISHSVFSFATGALGATIAAHVMRNPWAVLVAAIWAVIGAATYAQLSWGSKSLLRPFGFWGGVLGTVVGMICGNVFFHLTFAQLAIAAAIAAPFAQALGRLRCLTQGCCHGVQTDERHGIRVWQPQSRVVVLSGLGGQWILPTQTYSVLFNLALGVLLWSLWRSEALGGVAILGAYFLLTGLERFAEDAYRGEKQTRTIGGLREPQWFAVGALLVGMVLMALPSSVPASTAALGLFPVAATAVLAGVLAGFAMSIDFPKSTAPFSRLSG